MNIKSVLFLGESTSHITKRNDINATKEIPLMIAMERHRHYVLQILSLGTYQGGWEMSILWANQDIDL